jgi:hypothetical protein
MSQKKLCHNVLIHSTTIEKNTARKIKNGRKGKGG